MNTLIILQDDIDSLSYHRVNAIIEGFSFKENQVTVLYYKNFIDNIHQHPFKKIINYFFFNKNNIKEVVKFTKSNINYIGCKRLPIMGILETIFQDNWIYNLAKRNLTEIFDYCICVAPGAAQVGIKLKKNKSVKILIYDDCDYFPGFVKGIRSLFISYKEKKIFEYADKIITITPGLKELREKKYGLKNIKIISNGTSFKLIKNMQIKKDTTHSINFFYSGELSYWAGIDTFIILFKELTKQIDNLKFHIVGNGQYKPLLEKLCEKFNLNERIIFYGQLPYIETLKIMKSKADVGVITFRNNDLANYASPLKLFQYCANGLPIIGSNNGEIGRIIKNYKIGLCIQEKQPNTKDIENVYNFLKIINISDQYKRKSFAVAEIFDWENLMKDYRNYITN